MNIKTERSNQKKNKTGPERLDQKKEQEEEKTAFRSSEIKN